MKKLIFILLAIICIACNPNPNNMIDFTYADNLPIIGDTVNNEVVHFIVDSGANISLIDSHYYQENKHHLNTISEVEMVLHGIGGSSQKMSYTVSLNTKIGTCILQDADLTAVINKTNSYGYNVIGLIGSDILRHNYVINYQTKTVSRCN